MPFLNLYYTVVPTTGLTCGEWIFWDEPVEHLYYTVVYDIRQHFGAV